MHILAHHCVLQGTFESKGHASSDHPFVSFQILAEVGVLFIFELAVQSIGMHKTYLYSFFFWMDLRHTVFFPFFHSGRVLGFWEFENLMLCVQAKDLIGAASLLLDLSYITQLDQEALELHSDMSSESWTFQMTSSCGRLVETPCPTMSSLCVQWLT